MISSGSDSVSRLELETFLDHEQRRRKPGGNISNKCKEWTWRANLGWESGRGRDQARSLSPVVCSSFSHCDVGWYQVASGGEGRIIVINYYRLISESKKKYFMASLFVLLCSKVQHFWAAKLLLIFHSHSIHTITITDGSAYFPWECCVYLSSAQLKAASELQSELNWVKYAI